MVMHCETVLSVWDPHQDLNLEAYVVKQHRFTLVKVTNIYYAPPNFFGGAYSRRFVCPSVRPSVHNFCPGYFSAIMTAGIQFNFMGSFTTKRRCAYYQPVLVG